MHAQRFGIGIGAGQLLLAEHAVDHAVADSAGGVRRASAFALRHSVVTVDARPRDHRASAERAGAKIAQAIHAGSCWAVQKSASSKASVDSAPRMTAPASPAVSPNRFSARSEEHTSELQSLMRISYAVFC